MNIKEGVDEYKEWSQLDTKGGVDGYKWRRRWMQKEEQMDTKNRTNGFLLLSLF